MSGSTSLPPPNTRIVDPQGRISLIWRKFFEAILTRTGGSGATANALINGNSNERFAVAAAQTTAEAVPLAQFRSQPGQPFTNAGVGASPWSFSAPANGILILGGGTITDLEFQRGGAQANIGATGGAIPMRTNDIVIVAYSAAPTAIWAPN